MFLPTGNDGTVVRKITVWRGGRMGTERFGGELRRFGREDEGEPLHVTSPYEPAGDQPQAIARLAQGVRDACATRPSWA